MLLTKSMNRLLRQGFIGQKTCLMMSSLSCLICRWLRDRSVSWKSLFVIRGNRESLQRLQLKSRSIILPASWSWYKVVCRFLLLLLTTIMFKMLLGLESLRTGRSTASLRSPTFPVWLPSSWESLVTRIRRWENLLPGFPLLKKDCLRRRNIVNQLTDTSGQEPWLMLSSLSLKLSTKRVKQPRKKMTSSFTKWFLQQTN